MLPKRHRAWQGSNRLAKSPHSIAAILARRFVNLALILNDNHALWKAKDSDMATMVGLFEFGEVFGLAVALSSLYLIFYVLTSAYNDIALIRANILSTAIMLGVSFVGFASQSAQIIVCWLVRPALPDLPRRIAAGKAKAALLLGCVSLAASAAAVATLAGAMA